MKEDKIQNDIVMWLQRHGYWTNSIPNEAAAGNKVRQMKLVAMGLRAGAPDLLVWLENGVVLALEVKNELGHQSPAQKRFQGRLEALGHKYYVVRSVEDVSAILK